ncbi:hypothetical protein, partial [Nocardia cyriacigeorgica]|uniref:hypothetical protein n=1 Tax=Nocardia cyriacigeorgica TaxID=135487 RepID=UPI002457DFCF
MVAEADGVGVGVLPGGQGVGAQVVGFGQGVVQQDEVLWQRGAVAQPVPGLGDIGEAVHRLAHETAIGVGVVADQQLGLHEVVANPCELLGSEHRDVVAHVLGQRARDQVRIDVGHQQFPHVLDGVADSGGIVRGELIGQRFGDAVDLGVHRFDLGVHISPRIDTAVGGDQKPPHPVADHARPKPQLGAPVLLDTHGDAEQNDRGRQQPEVIR